MALSRTSTRPNPIREPLVWCESGGATPAKIPCEPRTQRAKRPSRLRRAFPLQNSRGAGVCRQREWYRRGLCAFVSHGGTKAFSFCVRKKKTKCQGLVPLASVKAIPRPPAAYFLLAQKVDKSQRLRLWERSFPDPISLTAHCKGGTLATT